MFKLIRKLFRPKNAHPNIDIGQIEHAFNWKGVAYYKFKDHPTIPAGNMPARRYQEFLTRHEAMRMGCNREFLEDFVKRGEEVFQPSGTGKNSGIDLNKIQRLFFELRQRLEFAPIGDDLFEYVSVIYFPLEENVMHYDPNFNREKIKAWKEGERRGDFFTVALRNLPVGITLNLPDSSPEAIENFLTVQDQVLQTLRNLSGQHSTI